jgi:hypothetical protein
MVKGFDKFKQFFSPHSESFIVIGGTAMQLHGEDGGFTPRVTQDIDILVIVENMSSAFTSAFHAFLREGRYECYMAKNQNGADKPRFYRFIKPKNEAFPTRIELLSSPLLPPPEGMSYMSLTDEPEESMSAIVLDRTYYEFAQANTTAINEVPCLNRDALMVFKSVAYLNLISEYETTGNRLRLHDSKKHRKDVLALIGAIPPSEVTSVPEEIAERLRTFASSIESTPTEWQSILDSLSDPSGNIEDYLFAFRRHFAL